jgi:hypothetical protein
MKNSFQLAIAGGFVALGLIILGVFINKGLQSFSNKERVVTVKGLAEKNIKAVSSNIGIDFNVSGDDPKTLVEKINVKELAIKSYLQSIGCNSLKINDLDMYDSKSYYDYDWENDHRVKIKKDRYNASKSIIVVVKEVEKVDSIANRINIELINQDLSSDVSTHYDYPELNEIKPQLIAESTKNARESGEQFAKDSKSRLGKIKTASQGQISLADRYYDDNVVSSAPTEPYVRKARVVSTIVFFLED